MLQISDWTQFYFIQMTFDTVTQWSDYRPRLYPQCTCPQSQPITCLLCFVAKLIGFQSSPVCKTKWLNFITLICLSLSWSAVWPPHRFTENVWLLSECSEISKKDNHFIALISPQYLLCLLWLYPATFKAGMCLVHTHNENCWFL